MKLAIIFFTIITILAILLPGIWLWLLLGSMGLITIYHFGVNAIRYFKTKKHYN